MKVRGSNVNHVFLGVVIMPLDNDFSGSFNSNGFPGQKNVLKPEGLDLLAVAVSLVKPR
jgi:hypothetical protein